MSIKHLYLGTAIGLLAALRAPEGEGGSEPPATKTSIAIEDNPSSEVSSATIGEDGKVASREELSDGMAMDFERDGSVRQRGGEPDESGSETTDADAGDTDASDEAPADGLGDGDEEVVDLPEYDPENAEVAEAYEKHFVKEVNGKPTLDIDGALGDEVYRNSQKEGGKPVLNDGTYAWLQDTFGVSREDADRHIAGRIALAQQQEQAFYSNERVGGKDRWEAVLKWGSENYKPEQKAKFNAALKAGGEEALEAIELLNARADKGGFKFVPGKEGEEKKELNKTPEAAKKLGLKTRRPVSPEKTAGSSEPPRGGKAMGGFEDNNEYLAALKAAKGDQAKENEVRKKLMASTFWKAKKG